MERPINEYKLNDISKGETLSETHLEDDEGVGGAAIVRIFEFGANPAAFKEHTPSQQELFNYHSKGIEVMLWRDGMTPLPEVEPKIHFNKNKTKYRIFVGAKPMKGHLLRERPHTLGELSKPNENK